MPEGVRVAVGASDAIAVGVTVATTVRVAEVLAVAVWATVVGVVWVGVNANRFGESPSSQAESMTAAPAAMALATSQPLTVPAVVPASRPRPMRGAST